MGTSEGIPFACPACHHPFRFRAKEITARVCPSCGELMFRSAVVHQSQKSAPVPEDASVIQVGTEGQWRGQAFEVLGWYRFQYDQKYLNAWVLLHADGSLAWLIESFGTYVYARADQAHSLLAATVGDEVHLNDSLTLALDRLQPCREVHVEGEFPIFEKATLRSVHVEMSDATGGWALAWKRGAYDAALLVGERGEFKHFEFVNLRKLHGWF